MQDPSAMPTRSHSHSNLSTAQLMCCAFLGALAITSLLALVHSYTLNLHSDNLIYCIAIFSSLALLNVPPVARRLPSCLRYAIYAAFLPAIIFFGVSVSNVQTAWEQTPTGAKEAAQRLKYEAAEMVEQAQREAAEKVEQDQRKDTARKLQELNELTSKVKELNSKLEGCFTKFGHRLPAFEESLKNSLHNPAAFEHVSTQLIRATDGNNNSNVEMEFRAENGFGAIRTARVEAQLVPEDCSVQNVGEIENE